ncbi:MAG: SRPBCC family protein [Bacteroidales bacterium]|nr:SRPBCC family protein [Bacteroidales bacterium]
MKILKWFLYIVLGLVTLLLVIAAFLPNKKVLKNSIVVNSYPRPIFGLVNSLKNWEKWSPFSEEDPSMVSEYSGSEYGVGSHQSWKSKKSGNGSMTILESVFEKKVVYDLDLDYGGKDSTLFILERVPEGTKITWETRISKAGYPMGRLMWLVAEGMMNKTFNKGLENLKKVVENLPPTCKSGDVMESIEPAKIYLTITDTLTTESIASFFGKAYGKIGGVMKTSPGVKMIGAPAAFYNGDPSNPTWIVTAAIPVNIEPKKLSQGISVLRTPEQKTVWIVHFGDYSTSSDSYYKLEDYIKNKGYQITGGSLEEYMTDPMVVGDPMKIETKISFPVK